MAMFVPVLNLCVVPAAVVGLTQHIMEEDEKNHAGALFVSC
jgi:uncharacterized protein involved in cysteine biosynthesis